MNNNIANADPKKVGELLHILGAKLGIPPEQLEKELSEGKFDSALKSMKPDAAAKFNQILKNPKLAEQIMSAPQAQAIYHKLTK